MNIAHRYKVGGKIIVSSLSTEEMSVRVARASASIKVSAGIVNNAAWSACLEALDNMKQLGAYKHKVKRAFNGAIAEFHNYEKNLIYTEVNRLFRVDDLTPDARKRYGDITDRELYEYWAASGAKAYTENRQWFTSMVNKFRLSLIAHNIADPSLVSWGMAADAALKLAVCVYEDNIVTASDQFGIPFALLDNIFQGLNMKAVEKKWDDAMMTLEPWTGTYELTEQEQRNIQLGLDQLWDAWVNLETMRDSLYSTAEAFDDIFRTRGEHKKALRQIKQMQIIRD